MEPKSSQIQVAINYMHLYLVASLLLVQFGKECFLLIGAPLFSTEMKKTAAQQFCLAKSRFSFLF